VRALALACLLALSGCGDAGSGPDVPVPGAPGAVKSSPTVRAARRAFEGAPPVIPHEPMGIRCNECHTERGMSVPELGFAPPSPHARTGGLSDDSRCNQCHVFRKTEDEFVANTFAGWRPEGMSGHRAYAGAPPVLPHPIFLRENCPACHSGPAAREEIRTTHPERENCTQCHAASAGATAFVR